MNFYSSILAALFARTQTGEGQHIVTSQTGATLYFQRLIVQASGKTGKQRDDGKAPGAPLRHVQQLQCAEDGKWFMISMAQKAQCQRFCLECLDRPDIVADPRFEAYPDMRGSDNGVDHRDWLRA